MPVVVQTPYSAHLANGVSDTFGYSFQLILATDLEVKLNGVVQTSGYTVSGVGVQAGGDVMFSSAPANNTLVELTRKIPLSRSTNYPYLGALPENEIDNDFDRIWQALQDLNYFGNTLSLKLPAGDAKAPMTLPSATSRASKYMAFDAEGGLIVSPGIADVPVSTFMATVVSAADAQAARDLLGAAASTNVRVDVASASTLNLDALTSDYSRITGTVAVESITLASGKRHISIAGGAFKLTNSASLIVQGGADFTTKAGDLLLFIAESGGVVRVYILRADGKSVLGGGEDQIFPIATPTLNAGAMTVTLSPCTITFRATSLTAGGVNSVSLPSGLSITIPSGATLGASSGVAARLALVVAYNAGTPVLCVVNLAGGVNLDETTLISPTTISGSSSSASTIYSASTVGSNSPFRVVGFLNSTQATAGTYATAPNVIGGATPTLGSMMTLGVGQTWQNTGRNRNTTFYNTTGRPIVFHVQVEAQSTSNVALFINVSGNQLNGISPGGNARASMSAVIPVGGSYSWGIQGDGGTTSAETYELR